MGKSYFEPPNPKRQQRKATPASPDQVHDYLDHMVRADREFHERTKPTTPIVRGSSQTAKNTRGSVPGIDAAIKKAGG